jgi:5'-methylthioadenosine phosphorylase
MPEPPAARFAHVGGSGTWGFPYPDGALDGHPHLAVEVVEPHVRVATPYGPSPAFRLCRLTDRRTGRTTDYLYVWMHGIDPENRSDAPGDSARASERVFDVLARAGVRRVIVDNSAGGVAQDLGPWDLAVVGDVLDLSGAVPRPVVSGLVRFREPLCSRLGRDLEGAARRALTRLAAEAGRGTSPRLKAGALYVHTPGPWFETPTEDRLYRRLGLDLVGKTAGPEFRLARMYGMCLGILSIVVNPAEGLGEFEDADLGAIYRRCGPIMARIVIEALADAAAEPDRAAACRCGDERGSSLFQAFAPHARYGGDRRVRARRRRRREP